MDLDLINQSIFKKEFFHMIKSKNGIFYQCLEEE